MTPAIFRQHESSSNGNIGIVSNGGGLIPISETGHMDVPRSYQLSSCLAHVQYSGWKQYLPLCLLGGMTLYKYDKPDYFPEIASHPLSSFRVRQLEIFLEELVTMGIDK